MTETEIRNNIVNLEILIEHSPSEDMRICAAWCREDWVEELDKLKTSG